MLGAFERFRLKYVEGWLACLALRRIELMHHSQHSSYLHCNRLLRSLPHLELRGSTHDLFVQVQQKDVWNRILLLKSSQLKNSFGNSTLGLKVDVEIPLLAQFESMDLICCSEMEKTACASSDAGQWIDAICCSELKLRIQSPLTLSQFASAAANVELWVDEHVPLVSLFEKTEVACCTQWTLLQFPDAFATVIAELQVDVERPLEMLWVCCSYLV